MILFPLLDVLRRVPVNLVHYLEGQRGLLFGLVRILLLVLDDITGNVVHQDIDTAVLRHLEYRQIECLAHSVTIGEGERKRDVRVRHSHLLINSPVQIGLRYVLKGLAVFLLACSLSCNVRMGGKEQLCTDEAFFLLQLQLAAHLRFLVLYAFRF